MHSLNHRERPFLIDEVLEDFARFDFPLKEIWLSAARFHFQNLDPEISALPSGACALEIGCGAGILMTLLGQKNPDIRLEGIEPFAEGFETMEGVLQHAQGLGAKIHRSTYEEYDAPQTYDLVYLVNVLEHLPDWRHFLDTLPRFLNPKGRCIVLCPNYGFPYEPHFNIPVVGSKATTGRLFQRRISWVEDTYGVHGLWNSLNFVRLSQIKRHLLGSELKLRVRHEITDRMIDRFNTDPVFQEHIGVFNKVGRSAKALGMTKVFRLGPCENIQPYMFLEFSRASE
jgi:2-polyprenyl-3-methyl-5-hydroxy-6-metoxy-1,4-benzoquinol methylase